MTTVSIYCNPIYKVPLVSCQVSSVPHALLAARLLEKKCCGRGLLG